MVRKTQQASMSHACGVQTCMWIIGHCYRSTRPEFRLVRCNACYVVSSMYVVSMQVRMRQGRHAVDGCRHMHGEQILNVTSIEDTTCTVALKRVPKFQENVHTGAAICTSMQHHSAQTLDTKGPISAPRAAMHAQALNSETQNPKRQFPVTNLCMHIRLNLNIRAKHMQLRKGQSKSAVASIIMQPISRSHKATRKVLHTPPIQRPHAHCADTQLFSQA